MTANGMLRPCSLHCQRVDAGRGYEGAPPCPTNRLRSSPRWASTSARTHSTFSASAARSCCGRNGPAAKSRHGRLRRDQDNFSPGGEHDGKAIHWPPNFLRERETSERLVAGQVEFLPRLKEPTNIHDA